jgi:DNA-binding response OmpR family regulator
MAYILIVEDEQRLAEAYQTILETHGHEVATGDDGEAGLKAVAERDPDLILLDMKLPHVTGLEFLRRLTDSGKLPLKPSVIIFSNQEKESEIEEAYRLGAKKYIVKTWASPRNLVKIVDEALGK